MKGLKTIGLDGVITTLLALSHDKLTSSVQISAEINYSISAVECFINKLKTINLIESRKGPHGGYRLSCPLEDLYVSDIIPLVNRRNKVTQIAFSAIRHQRIKDTFSDLMLKK